MNLSTVIVSLLDCFRGHGNQNLTDRNEHIIFKKIAKIANMNSR